MSCNLGSQGRTGFPEGPGAKGLKVGNTEEHFKHS